MEPKKFCDGPRRLSCVVGPDRAGQKVDAILRGQLGLSGTVIRRIKWLEEGILLDGRRVCTSQRAGEGQLLSALVGDEGGRSGLPPVPGPLDIAYEDADLLVVNKAPGVCVHPGPGHYGDTLGNFLMDYYEKRGIRAGFHPVHRLDKGTSGLMVVAKHPHAQELLKGQLHTGAFRRGYLAVCEGEPRPDRGLIDVPIGRREGSLVERQARPDGLPARTRYQVLGTAGGRALVGLELETGRTHQIRVHMAWLGHPLTGDFLYGTEDRELISRPALHSARLELVQPITGEAIRLTAGLPGDMRGLMGRRQSGLQRDAAVSTPAL